MLRRFSILIAGLLFLGAPAEAGRLHVVENAAVTGLRSLDPRTGELGEVPVGPAIDPRTGVLHRIGRMAFRSPPASDGVALIRRAGDYPSERRPVPKIEVPAAPAPVMSMPVGPMPTEQVAAEDAPAHTEPYALLGIGMVGLTGWVLRFRSRTS
jgi:hypothetical protein